jgi:hypothetical protein
MKVRMNDSVCIQLTLSHNIIFQFTHSNEEREIEKKSFLSSSDANMIFFCAFVSFNLTITAAKCPL